MVFQDISSSFVLNDFAKKKSAASIVDRLFSFIIDYLVISPFVFFLLRLTFNNGIIFWKSHPEAPESDLLVLLLIFTYVVYFSLIQSAFIAMWKATPGQYFLKIKIFCI